MAEFQFPSLVLAENATREGANKRSSCGCAGSSDDPEGAFELEVFSSKRESNSPSSFPSDKKTTPLCRNTVCDQSTNHVRIIIGCDARRGFPYSIATIKVNPPFSSIGAVSTGGTGFVIAPNLVMTAAHVILNPDLTLRSKKVKFLPGRRKDECAFPGKWIESAYIPTGFKYSSKPSPRTYDWAVLKLSGETIAPPMEIGGVSVDQIVASTLFSAGYPGSLDEGKILYWGSGNTVDDDEGPILADLDGGPGQLLRTTLDGEPGQSGSPVYLFSGQKRVAVGVMIGSSNCNAMWAPFFSTDFMKTIAKLISDPDTAPTGMNKFVFEVPKEFPSCAGIFSPPLPPPP